MPQPHTTELERITPTLRRVCVTEKGQEDMVGLAFDPGAGWSKDAYKDAAASRKRQRDNPDPVWWRWLDAVLDAYKGRELPLSVPTGRTFGVTGWRLHKLNNAPLIEDTRACAKARKAMGDEELTCFECPFSDCTREVARLGNNWRREYPGVVQDIEEELRKGGVTQVALAKKYGVSNSVISQMKKKLLKEKEVSNGKRD